MIFGWLELVGEGAAFIVCGGENEVSGIVFINLEMDFTICLFIGYGWYCIEGGNDRLVGVYY